MGASRPCHGRVLSPRLLPTTLLYRRHINVARVQTFAGLISALYPDLDTFEEEEEHAMTDQVYVLVVNELGQFGRRGGVGHADTRKSCELKAPSRAH